MGSLAVKFSVEIALYEQGSITFVSDYISADDKSPFSGDEFGFFSTSPQDLHCMFEGPNPA